MGKMICPATMILTKKQVIEKWDESPDNKSVVIFLRMPAKLKEILIKKAKQKNLSLNEYCVRILGE